MRLPLLFLVLLAAAPALGAQAPGLQAYTDSQALRGKQWFDASCLHCHAVKDMTSPDFRVRWSGRSALELFVRIRETMPEDEPGTLSSRTYTDIVAYLMQLNGLVAGVQPLTADSTVLASAKLGFPLPASAPR